eukprot:COSAG02_NODE_18756_length_918_cov_0.961071_1_plen_125_part_00
MTAPFVVGASDAADDDVTKLFLLAEIQTPSAAVVLGGTRLPIRPAYGVRQPRLEQSQEAAHRVQKVVEDIPSQVDHLANLPACLAKVAASWKQTYPSARPLTPSHAVLEGGACAVAPCGHARAF